MRAGSALFVAAVLGSALTLGLTARANANTLNIYNGGPAAGVDIDLSVSITGTTASFSFTNNSAGAAANASVHEIYFEQGLGSLLSKPYTL